MVVLFSCGSFVWFFYFHTIPSHHSFISRWFFCMINLFLHLILSHDSYISTSDSFHVNLWFSHDSFTQFFYFHMILSHGLFFTCDSFVWFFYFHVIFFPHNFFFLFPYVMFSHDSFISTCASAPARFICFPHSIFIRDSFICSYTTVSAAVIENESTFCPRRFYKSTAPWYKSI